MQLLVRPYLRKGISGTFQILVIFPDSFARFIKVDAMLELAAVDGPAGERASDKCAASEEVVEYAP